MLGIMLNVHIEVMFNSCINMVNYTIDFYMLFILINKHKFFIYFKFISVMVKYVINRL